MWEFKNTKNATEIAKKICSVYVMFMFDRK